MKLRMSLHEKFAILLMLCVALLLDFATDGPPVASVFLAVWAIVLLLYRLQFNYNYQQRRKNNVIKVKITRIGTITEDGTVMDWTFDGSGFGPQPIALVIDKNLIGGYTVKELQEIISLKHKLDHLTKGGYD